MLFYFNNTDKNRLVAWDVPNEAKLITLMVIEMTLDDSHDLQFTELGDSVHIYLNENQISGMIHKLKGLDQVPCVTSFISELEFLRKPCLYGTA